MNGHDHGSLTGVQDYSTIIVPFSSKSFWSHGTIASTQQCCRLHGTGTKIFHGLVWGTERDIEKIAGLPWMTQHPPVPHSQALQVVLS